MQKFVTINTLSETAADDLKSKGWKVFRTPAMYLLGVSFDHNSKEAAISRGDKF